MFYGFSEDTLVGPFASLDAAKAHMTRLGHPAYPVDYYNAEAAEALRLEHDLPTVTPEEDIELAKEYGVIY